MNLRLLILTVWVYTSCVVAYSLNLCEHTDLKGTCISMSGRAHHHSGRCINLSKEMNDKVSSVQTFWHKCTLYADRDCQGQHYGPFKGRRSELKDFNDKMSSFQCSY